MLENRNYFFLLEFGCNSRNYRSYRSGVVVVDATVDFVLSDSPAWWTKMRSVLRENNLICLLHLFYIADKSRVYRIFQIFYGGLWKPVSAAGDKIYRFFSMIWTKIYYTQAFERHTNVFGPLIKSQEKSIHPNTINETYWM